jgi:hypothetical protein
MKVRKAEKKAAKEAEKARKAAERAALQALKAAEKERKAAEKAAMKAAKAKGGAVPTATATAPVATSAAADAPATVLARANPSGFVGDCCSSYPPTLTKRVIFWTRMPTYKVGEFPDPYVTIHRLKWNPNASAAGWLAYGGRSGLLRVRVVPGV